MEHLSASAIFKPVFPAETNTHTHKKKRVYTPTQWGTYGNVLYVYVRVKPLREGLQIEYR